MTNTSDIEALRELARRIVQQRFPEADSALLCGSVARGEASSTSDLDIVVLFAHVDAGWRESFHFEGWPVECFCHDLETAEYFFVELDRPSGIGALTHMVLDGIAVADASPLLRRLVARARQHFEAGPPPFGPDEIEYSRYTISSLMDDLRGAHTAAERCAIATVLYALLAMHVFRSRNLWSAHGKLILRRLRMLDADLALRYETAFAALFAQDDTAPLLELCESVLAPDGGCLFDGYDPPRVPARRIALPPEEQA